MKKFFFVTFVLSFVRIVVLQKGRGGMGGRKQTCVVIDRKIGGRLRCCFSYIPVFTVGFVRLVSQQSEL